MILFCFEQSMLRVTHLAERSAPSHRHGRPPRLGPTQMERARRMPYLFLVADCGRDGGCCAMPLLYPSSTVVLEELEHQDADGLPHDGLVSCRRSFRAAPHVCLEINEREKRLRESLRAGARSVACDACGARARSVGGTDRSG